MIAIIGFTYTLFFLLSVVLAATNQANVMYSFTINNFLLGIRYYNKTISIYPFFFMEIELDFNVYLKVLNHPDGSLAGYVIGGSTKHYKFAENQVLYRFIRVSKKEFTSNACQPL